MPGKDAEQKNHLHSAVGSAKWFVHFGKWFGNLPCDLEILLLGFYP